MKPALSVSYLSIRAFVLRVAASLSTSLPCFASSSPFNPSLSLIPFLSILQYSPIMNYWQKRLSTASHRERENFLPPGTDIKGFIFPWLITRMTAAEGKWFRSSRSLLTLIITMGIMLNWDAALMILSRRQRWKRWRSLLRRHADGSYGIGLNWCCCLYAWGCWLLFLSSGSDPFSWTRYLIYFVIRTIHALDHWRRPVLYHSPAPLAILRFTWGLSLGVLFNVNVWIK